MFGRRRGRGTPYEGINLLHLRPIRQADWTEGEDGPVILTRWHPKRRGKKGLGARVDHWLGTPRLKLDETGTFAWLRFDGDTTVGEVAAALRESQGEGAEPVEQPLGAFDPHQQREARIRYAELDPP
ncbi:MAG: PqqD family protein [Gemmatimonadota bacterium]